MTTPDSHPMLDEVVRELASVLTRLVGAEAHAEATASAAEFEWAVKCAVNGDLTGDLVIAFRDGDVREMAVAITGAAAADDQMVVDTVGEVLGQAIGSASPWAAAARMLIVGQAERAGAALPTSPPVVFRIVQADRQALVGLWFVPAPTEEASAAAPASPVKAPGAAKASGPARGVPENLDVILDIELPMSVRFGQTEMTLEALTRLGPGSVIDLGRPPDDPVEVLVNGRAVARGEVVVVAGNYGVRIL